ncbi:MAG: DNA methylase [Robiginitomaculum sp.]|nr:MAG: DNA methylase [Robiginitomaculum sp.]
MTSYLGAKTQSGTWQRILGAMPPHDTYIELFLGSGAIMNRRAALGIAAMRTIGVEIDRSVVAKFGYPEGTEILNKDALWYLRQMEPGPILSGGDPSYGKVLIYADPPYMLETRTSRHRYAHDFTHDDHVALLSALKALECDMILSGYPSALYDEMLDDWRKTEFQAMTRGGVRTECLWMNYAQYKPFWHTIAGENSAERWRISKKSKRWGHRLARLPDAEKMACFAACCEAMEKGDTS